MPWGGQGCAAAGLSIVTGKLEGKPRAEALVEHLWDLWIGIYTALHGAARLWPSPPPLNLLMHLSITAERRKSPRLHQPGVQTCDHLLDKYSGSRVLLIKMAE